MGNSASASSGAARAHGRGGGRRPSQRSGYLQEYKGQSHVEPRFRYLKDPMMVDAVFLKTPRGVQAIGYVILLAVLVAALLERCVCEALQQAKETMLAPGNRKLSRPAATVLLEILRILELCGCDRSIYLGKT